MQLGTSFGCKRVWALSAAALGIAVGGCGGSHDTGGGSVAKALASNPPARVTAVSAAGQSGVTVLLDPQAVHPLPAGGRVAVPVLVSNRDTTPQPVHLAITLNPSLMLSGAQPALPSGRTGSGWSCEASACTYLRRAANGSTGPAQLPAGAQLPTMVVVAAPSRIPAGARARITVSPNGPGRSAGAQSAPLRLVPANQAAPALILSAAGTAAGVTPGGQAVARYQVLNGGSAAISPGSLTVNGTLPHGFARGWSVAGHNWNCESNSAGAPSCRLRTGVAVGAQAPELVMAYSVASRARGNRSWTAHARATSAHGAGTATTRLLLSAGVEQHPNASQPRLRGVPGPGPGLTVGAGLGDSLRRGGYAPLRVTILNGGDEQVRSKLRVQIHLPSGLRAGKAGAAGWSCHRTGGQTITCRHHHVADLSIDSAMTPISVGLHVRGGARGAEPITVDASAGAAHGSTTIRPGVENPFTVQASALPSAITNAPKRAVAGLRMVRASDGGLDSQQGILTATPSDPYEPGVQYIWHQDCTRGSDLRAVHGCTRLLPRVTWLVPSRNHDAIGQSARYIAPSAIPGTTLRFTVTVTGAGSPARATTTVRVIRNEDGVWAPQPKPRVRASAPMPGYRQINLKPAISHGLSPLAVQPVDPGPRPDDTGVEAALREHRMLLREYRARPLAPLPRAQSSTTFCNIFAAAAHGEIRNLALREDLNADFLGVGTTGTSCTDPAAKVTFGGQSALRVGTAFTLDRISGTITSGGVAITTATMNAPADWATLPFTLSSGSQLQIQFGDGSTVQPLAGVITSSTFAILPLVPPMGVGGTHTTDLTFGDTVTGGQRISIAGTAAADGASADLRGPIALDGSFDISGSENGIFNMGDCSMNVAGKLRRTVAGGSIAKDLTGTMSTCHPLGNVTLSNGTGRWADGAVQVDATGSVDGPGGRNLALKVGGKISSLSKWSLSVSTADGFMWKPAAFLSITKIGGSLARADGKTTFSLDGEVGSWKVNDNLVFGQSKVRITNECSPGVQCQTGLARVLFDVSGDFYPRYAISYDLHLSFTAQGSVEIPSGAISIAAQPSLGPIPFGEFKLKNPKLGLADAGPAADGSGAHTLAVTLTATVSFWGKDLDVHGEFSADGYWFLASLGSWSPSDKYPELFGLKDANIVYSSYGQPDRKLGEPDRQYTVDLKAGAPQIAASYPIPTLIDTLFGGKLKYGWLTADISFSDKITFTGTIHFRTDEPDIYLLGSSGSLIALKAKIPYLKVGIVQGGEPTIGIADNVSFVYPKFSGGETGSIDLTMAADLSLKSKSISGSISNTTGWDPFMGITGFAIHQFAIQVDYTPGTAPSYGIAGTVSFPDWLNTGLNLTHGTRVSLAMKLNPSEPCLAMGVENADKSKDAIDLLNTHLVTAKNAGFVLAPKGCDIGAISYPRGASFNLNARIFGVDVKFNARVAVEGTSFEMQAHAEIGAFNIGNVVGLQKTTLDVDIDNGVRKKFNIEFDGGISVPGATAHVDGSVKSHDGIAALELHGDAEGTKLGDIQVPGKAKFDLSATADLGTVGALKTLKTTMDADMKVLGNGIHMHFDLDYANYAVRKMSASQEVSFGIPSVATLGGKVVIGYESGKGSAGYEGKIEAFGFPLFRTAGKLDASLSELAVDADLVDLRSPWIGIYIVNFRASVNIHLRGNLSLSKLNVGAEGRAEIEGEVCYIVSCSSFGSIGVNPGFNFNPFQIKICASIPVIGWQCLEIGGGSSPGPPPPPPPPKPIVGLPAYVAPGSLIRMYSDPLRQHIVTRGGRPGGQGGGAVDWTKAPFDTYSYEGTLGFVDPIAQPGEQWLYSCENNGDQFISLNKDCIESGHQYGQIGAIGADWPTKPAGDGLEYREILRCISGGRDHFVTYADKNCEGTKRDFSLGWIAQSQPRLELYVAKDGTRTTTTRAVLSEVGAPAGTVGFLLPHPGPGRQALYSCQRPNDNKPRFLTPRNDCQGFADMLGIEGWDWTSPAPPGQLPRTKMTQCYTELPGHKINYVLKLGDDIGDCVAQRDLGYIDDTQSGLDQFYDGSRHWASTRAVPAQYQFQTRFGFLFQSGGNGRIPLYSCLKGVGDFQAKDTSLKDVQEFLSRDPGCDHQHVEGLDGWLSPTRTQQTTYQLFLCSYGRDRFLWLNAGCDGKQLEEELGWDSPSPTTSG